MPRKVRDVYRQGARAYRANKSWKDNPYKHGTGKWQEWFNGFGDESDKDFLKLVKICPSILIDK